MDAWNADPLALPTNVLAVGAAQRSGPTAAARSLPEAVAPRRLTIARICSGPPKALLQLTALVECLHQSSHLRLGHRRRELQKSGVASCVSPAVGTDRSLDERLDHTRTGNGVGDQYIKASSGESCWLNATVLNPLNLSHEAVWIGTPLAAERRAHSLPVATQPPDRTIVCSRGSALPMPPVQPSSAKHFSISAATLPGRSDVVVRNERGDTEPRQRMFQVTVFLPSLYKEANEEPKTLRLSEREGRFSDR